MAILRTMAAAATLGLCCAGMLASGRLGWADDKTPPAKAQPLKLPPGWKPDDPLPMEKSNCVRCHLTAGRELTAPVRDFARSVHDLARMSCNNCHGGNTQEDKTAHEAEHEFIGTKLSAHVAACAGCHTHEAQSFKKSKHYRDLSKGIKREYPVCVDCHGNHDIGKPPAEFALMNVCTDCHKQFAKDQPHAAAVVAENDRLWLALRKVQAKNQKAAEPIPDQFQRELGRARAATARLMHHGRPVTAQEARDVNDKTVRLRAKLEAWLKEQR